MPRFWREWWNRRKAVAAARRYLKRTGTEFPLAAAQRQEVLSLRSRFFREKMGTWPERLALYLLAADLPANACVVEIGAWVGVGTAYLGCGLRSGRGGRVFAVDTFEGTTLDPTAHQGWRKSVAKMGGNSLEALRANIRAFSLDNMVSVIVNDSREAARRWRAGPIDLLYIDGDHVYEAVKADYHAWSGFVPQGGFIVFHDYDDRHPGVKRCVDELLAGELAGREVRQVDSLLIIRR